MSVGTHWGRELAHRKQRCRETMATSLTPMNPTRFTVNADSPVAVNANRPVAATLRFWGTATATADTGTLAVTGIRTGGETTAVKAAVR